jgi:hypothetical protein
MHNQLLALVLIACAACGGSGGGGGGGDGGADGGTGEGQGGGDAGGASGTDGGTANIEAVLDCGTPRKLFNEPAPGDMQTHEVDNTLFPDALCNDGTPPVLYYRPHRGASNRNKWVISLRGGGACGTAADCAARWCNCSSTTACPYATVTTNFTLDHMSGGGSRREPGGGVLTRAPGRNNPLADYNQVQLAYCTSDAWSGAARAMSMSTTHPKTGQPVTYTMHFMGTRVLDADLAILRREGAPALSYTLDGPAVDMPDLDEAETVVLVGDSAGGAGIINNLDHVAELLRSGRSGCDGGADCPPSIVGVIDAIVGPEFARLDFSNSAGADAGITTYEKYAGLIAQGPSGTTGRGDQSCRAYHSSDDSVCADVSHVLRNHLTTPFFVRMALLDSLIARIYADTGAADPVLGPLDRPLTFGRVLQREFAAFPTMPARAEEGSLMTKAPGVFGPACTKHDTIHNDVETYETSVTADTGVTHTFFSVFNEWNTGGSPTVVVSQDPAGADTRCP